METSPKAADAIIEHVRRYRMTTLSAVRRMRELRQYKTRFVRHVLDSLCESSVLGRATLYRGLDYFYLNQPADESAAVNVRGGRLSETAKIRNYALLHHCCLGAIQRRRLTADDLLSYLPEIHRSGVPLNYYINLDSSLPRLGYVRVDVGGRGRWDRILSKCRDDLRLHWSHGGCREFIKRNLFEITLITTLPQKAARIQRTLKEANDPKTRMIRVVTCPDLINLIAPPPT